MIEIQKYKIQKFKLKKKKKLKFKNTNTRNTDIQIIEVLKCKLQDYKKASEEELPKSPRGTIRSKRYLMVQEVPKGLRGI